MRALADRAWDCVEERRIGIASAGLIPIETLISEWEDCHDYAPTGIAPFRLIMSGVEISPGRDVFVDFGCGLGRVLALASAYPFRKIIGVEISASLVERARANLRGYRGRRLCHDIEIFQQSADTYTIPPEATLLFFYNPFHGQILARVFDRIRDSMELHPRRLQVVFYNPRHFAKMADRYPWLVPRRHYTFEYDCILYEAAPQLSAPGVPQL